MTQSETVEGTKKKISLKKKTSGAANGDLTPKEKESASRRGSQTGEETKQAHSVRIPSISVSDDTPKTEKADSQPASGTAKVKAQKSTPAVKQPAPADSKPVVTIVDDSSSGPEEPSSDSRRGSGTPTPAGTSRRPSIIVADEKGLVVDDSGQTKKLRPGEMLEVGRRGSRRGSFDMRRASSVEIDRADKPSTPLKALGEQGPPVITDYDENVTAVENKTALLQATVEGIPVPKFKFYRDNTEIFEGGRYKVVTDGETNTVYFCIRKAKSNDEGKYKIVAYNENGEDSCNIKLFVSGE